MADQFTQGPAQEPAEDRGGIGVEFGEVFVELIKLFREGTQVPVGFLAVAPMGPLLTHMLVFLDFLDDPVNLSPEQGRRRPRESERRLNLSPILARRIPHFVGVCHGCLSRENRYPTAMLSVRDDL